MVHSPVRAIEIHVDETPVGTELAHLQQRVIGEDVRHVKAAHLHVVRAVAEFELIELVRRGEAVLKAGEDRILQLGRSELAPEIEAEALFCELSEGTSE